MKILKYFIKNLLVFFVGWVLCFAELNSAVSPFFVAFIFALAVVNNRLWDFYFGAIAARMTFNFSFFSVLSTLNLAFVLVLFWLILKKRNERVRFIVAFVALVFASAIDIVYSAFAGAEVFALKLVSVLLSLAFLYAYVLIMRAVKIRGTSTNLTIDEVLGLALILAPVALACAKVQFCGISLASFFVPLIIFFVMDIWGGVQALSVAIIAGLGVSFLTLELSSVAIFCFWAIGATTVRRLKKPVSVLVVLVIDFVLGTFFRVYENYGVINLLPILISGIIFCIIPKKWMNKLKLWLCNGYVDVCLTEVVEQEQRVLKERLARVSGLFLDMNKIYLKMVVGRLDREQIEDVIKSNLIRENCENCLKYKTCYEGRGIAPRCILELVKKGISKKSCSLVDTPTLLASICGKTNQIIFQLNNHIKSFLKCEKEIQQEDEGKILISNQLLGVSELMDELAMSFSFGERASKEKEKSLINSFLFNDIIIKECAIFLESGVLGRAVMVIKNAGYKKSKVLAVANQFFKTKTKILDIRYTKVSGWQVITLVRAPKYTYAVGVAKVAKDGVSGDTFSELKVDDTRAVFGISDGKGSGPNAKKISEMTINLIENFYKAGFSTTRIIENVNKVMSYKSGENFSAVDIVSLDLDELRADFVKKGGTPTVIKKARHAVVIEGNDLPIGMMEGSSTKIENHYLDAGDVVVLTSDGVFDAFNSSDNFAGFINNTLAVNMQEFANAILGQAIRLYNGTPKDDMTVLAIKVLVNR